MIIMYGYRTNFKREGNAGVSLCPNCGHEAPHTLCRLLNQGTLFALPIISITKKRGIVCENCGELEALGKREYKEKREQLKRLS